MGSPLAYYGVGDLFVNKTVHHHDHELHGRVRARVCVRDPDDVDQPRTAAGRTGSSTTRRRRPTAWSSSGPPEHPGGIDRRDDRRDRRDVPRQGQHRRGADLPGQGGAHLERERREPDVGFAPHIDARPAGDHELRTAAYTLGSQTVPGTWDALPHVGEAPTSRTRTSGSASRTSRGNCGTLSVNNLVVTVYSHTTTTTTTTTLNDPGRQRRSDVPREPGCLGRGDHTGRPTGERRRLRAANNGGLRQREVRSELGYDYVISLPSGGTVKVFDPGYCAMGANGVGGSMGVGDHWIGTAAGTPVSTYYTLWNTNGKLGLHSAWSQLYTSGTLFENQTGYDPANTAPGGAGRYAVRCDVWLRRLSQRVVDHPDRQSRGRHLRPAGPDVEDPPAERQHGCERQQRHERREHVVDRGGRRQRAGLRQRPDGRLQQPLL